MFNKFKNSLNIISKLIITKIRQIKLLMLCYTFYKETKAKKKFLGLRILKSFVIYSFY